MKRIHFSILRTVALSAFLFTTSCASDGPDSVEEVEDENRIHERSDDSTAEAELPNAEQAAADAQAATASEGGDGAVDSNWTGEVQQLPSEQQMAAEENTVGNESPEQFQMKQTDAAPEAPLTSPTLGAETDAASPLGSDSSATATAETEMATSPSLPAEAEASTPDPIQTLVDVVNDSDATGKMDSAKNEIKHAKKKASKGSKKARTAKKSKSKGTSNRTASSSITPNGDGKVYVVRPGDTLGRIAKLIYGTSRRWPELAAKNNLTGTTTIFPGDSITYNPDASSAAFEAKWDGLNKASAKVAQGESLSKVAARVMGSGHYWKMLWQWNQDSISDPNKIAVGQEIKYVAIADMNSALSPGKNSTDAH